MAHGLQEPHSRGEVVEFALAESHRRAFDPDAWRASLAGRRRMPPLDVSSLDPRLVDLARDWTHRFIADEGSKATVRPADAHDEPHGFVTGVDVAADAGFVPGTLAVRVTPESTRDVDPRTLHLVWWNPRSRRHELVHAAGLNIDSGYVWGRITRPGRYKVFGLLTPAALDKVSAGDLRAFSVMSLIITRLFSPVGPWESLGPRHLSCCIVDVAIDPASHDRLYAGASDGGLWRLDSLAAYPAGTWVPLTDQQPSLQIACFAVSPADSQVVYYVDALGYLHRSSDRGQTWSFNGSTFLGSARRLLAHPSDADTIYVATNTGLWCSHTAGATWHGNSGQTTLHDGDVTDAAMDPGDASVLYAAERNVGLLKSIDAGTSWQTMLPWSAADTPAGSMIKIAVGGLGSDATRTVAVKFDQEIFVNRHGGRGPMVLGGGPWTSRGKYGQSGYGDWCHVIAVDPFDDDVILAGAQQLYRTGDGGMSWAKVIDYYAPHEDQHRVLFDPSQSGVVYAANDGGVFRSADHGLTWQTAGDDVALKHDLTLGLVTAQFYTAAISGNHAIGDAYHQGLLGASSLAVHEWAGIEGHAWEFNNVYGDPVRPGRFYVFTGTALFRRTFPDPGTGPALVQIGNFRPMAIAVDARPGSNVLLVATATGTVVRAPDGDTDTPTWTPMAGLTLSGDTIASLAFAPSRPQQAYALSRGGHVFLCADVDAAPTWTARTSLPDFDGSVIAVSAEDEGHLYAIGASQVYRSVDGAGSWTAVPGTGMNVLPSSPYYQSLVAGPGTIYVASSSGVFTSPDAGDHWFSYQDGLPNAWLAELLWTEGDLFAVTHGRGLWHHGRYDFVAVPPVAHKPDLQWIVNLYIAIHGGDPVPEAIRQRIGHGLSAKVIAGH